jgi:hypothetical protein
LTAIAYKQASVYPYRKDSIRRIRMKLPTYQWLGQMLAALGVIISLSLLVYEMKLARDTAAADIYQQRSAMWLDIALSKYSPEQYAAIINKRGSENSTFTRADVYVVSNAYGARFTYFENLHFQYQLGMISEEEWSATQRSISYDFLRPCGNAYWQRTKQFWRESFVAAIDRLLKQLDIPACDIPGL